MHSELSYGLSIAPKLQRVGSIHFPGWDQPTPDPSFSRQLDIALLWLRAGCWLVFLVLDIFTDLSLGRFDFVDFIHTHHL